MSYIYDDAGKAASKRPKQSNDCVVRAMALAAAMRYDDVYDLLATRGRVCNHTTKKNLWKKVLEEGLNNYTFKKQTFNAVKGESRMNVGSFISSYKTGTYIIFVAKHLFVVIDGTLHDMFRTPDHKCVYQVYEVIKNN